jgi:UDP-N-acetylmuramoyl-L-alanyl-D-glutamate--2,6-diaminopimelate ligase
MITFGLNDRGDITAENIAFSSRHMTFDITYRGRRFSSVSVGLFGKLQIANILCAIALAYASGLTIDNIIDALKKITPLDGRMEHVVTTTNGANVYVDYAHTAGAFRRALLDFKTVCTRKLICVFGCGGDRDRSKREEMGIAASEIADVVIVTDDNPRSEDPASIRQTVLSVSPGAIEIGNRGNAIAHAISIARCGDIIAIIGKGHECIQIHGISIITFNDREEVLKVCSALR